MPLPLESLARPVKKLVSEIIARRLIRASDAVGDYVGAILAPWVVASATRLKPFSPGTFSGGRAPILSTPMSLLTAGCWLVRSALPSSVR
jgi:hypothetical protein